LGIVEPQRIDRNRSRRGRVRRRDDDKRAIHWLLAIPIVMPLLVPLYNRIDPKIAGIPFFYWYQMATALVAIVVLTFLYQVTKDRN
jgi:putative solute:sodium symporter small subunit